MTMILQTPSIEAISSFDPAYEATINFYYNDNQPYKNRVIITDNSTSNIVYDKTQDSMRLYVTIPANTLIAGKQYLAQVQIYDIDGNHSNLSDPVLFYCFTTPVLKFIDINDNDVYRNASINLTLSYFQAQNEEIKDYQFALYSEERIIESLSDVIYSPSLFPYTFYGLKNNTKYFLRAYGETINGMKMDTGYIGINVQYDVIPANIAFQITNVYKSGYIQIETNILSVGYELENDNYKFEDGMLTLTDNSLTYNEGFEITDDFSLFVEAKKLPVTRFLRTNDDNISLSIINICDTYYCKLNVKNSDIVMCVSLPKARLCTDSGSYIVTDDGRQQIEIINTSYEDDDLVVFELKRIKGLYSLNAYYKAERMVRQ